MGTPVVGSLPSSSRIKVLCRVRPLTEREARLGHAPVITLSRDRAHTIDFHGNPSASYTWDGVFGPDSTQAEVYSAVGPPAVTSVLRGVNATIMCYGQTSSGKTYTMTGPGVACAPPLTEGGDAAAHVGLVPRALAALFEAANALSQRGVCSTVIHLRYIELYCESARDLLSHCRPLGPGAAAPRRMRCKSFEDAIQVLSAGAAARATAPTGLNSRSSRSHTMVFTDVEVTPKQGKRATRALLTLVDLAGSERISKTEASGATLTEAKKINSGLHQLANVVRMLATDRSAHVPYRNSRLTRLLQDSLGGSSETCVLVCATPAQEHAAETHGALVFGQQAMRVRNTPTVRAFSPRVTEAEVRGLRAEVGRLQAQIRALTATGAGAGADTRAGAGVGAGATVELLQRHLASVGAEAAAARDQISELQEALAESERAVDTLRQIAAGAADRALAAAAAASAAKAETRACHTALADAGISMPASDYGSAEFDGLGPEIDVLEYVRRTGGLVTGLETEAWDELTATNGMDDDEFPSFAPSAEELALVAASAPETPVSTSTAVSIDMPPQLQANHGDMPDLPPPCPPLRQPGPVFVDSGSEAPQAHPPIRVASFGSALPTQASSLSSADCETVLFRLNGSFAVRRAVGTKPAAASRPTQPRARRKRAKAAHVELEPFHTLHVRALAPVATLVPNQADFDALSDISTDTDSLSDISDV